MMNSLLPFSRMAWKGSLFLACVACLFGGSLLAQSFGSPALLWEMTLTGEEESKLRWPVAVASVATGEILVADGFKDRLVLFRSSAVDGTWKADKVGNLPGPPRTLAAHNGRYFVGLRGASGLFEVESPSLQLRKVGAPSGLMPAAIAAGNGDALVIYDAAGPSILRLSDSGSVTKQIGVRGEISALAVAVNGDIYASVAQPAEIRRYSADGELLDTWTPPKIGPFPPWPAGLAVEVGGKLYISDRRAGALLVLDTSSGRLLGSGSRQGWESGLLNRPAGIGLLPDGKVAVADQGNGRVQIFRPVD